MAQQSWVNLLNAGAPWQTAQGPTLSTAATATISPQAPTTQDFVLPGQPNGLQWYTGMQLRLRARGVLTTGGTTTSLTLFPAIGVSGTLATTLCTPPAVVLGATTLTTLARGRLARGVHPAGGLRQQPVDDGFLRRHHRTGSGHGGNVDGDVISVVPGGEVRGAAVPRRRPGPAVGDARRAGGVRDDVDGDARRRG